jgi:hypothetical protein
MNLLERVQEVLAEVKGLQHRESPRFREFSFDF